MTAMDGENSKNEPGTSFAHVGKALLSRPSDPDILEKFTTD
ncbi:MAG: hypothetical protein ACJAUT_000185 [Cellvibrionaceae bacterium]|jgi:hypothetical protein